MQNHFKRLTASVLLLLMVGVVPCVAQDADEGDDRMQQGQTLLGRGEFQEASEIFRAVAEDDEENALAHFLLGYTLHMTGDLESALEAHKAATEFEDFRAIATYNIGCAHSLLGNRDKAFEALYEAVELGYRDEGQFASDSDLDSLRGDQRFAVLMARIEEDEETEKMLAKAQELLQEEAYAEAAEVYQGLVEANKDNGFAVFRLGYALHAAGEIDKAIEVHQQAAEFDEFKGIATYNLGCAYCLKGEKELALDALGNAIEAGFARPDYMLSDPDLESLRDDETFTKLVAKAEEMVNQDKSDDSTASAKESDDN